MDLDIDSAAQELFRLLFLFKINIDNKTDDKTDDKNELSKIKDLLDKVVDINVRNEEGYTLLHYASLVGNRGILNMLFDRADAIWLENQKKKSILQRIFTRSSDKRINLNAIGKDGQTPLHFVAYFGHKDVVEMLLKRGVNVNIQDGCGRTPLHLTAHKGHKDVVDILVKVGAKVNIKDLNRWTPLHYAVYWNHKDTVDLLLKRGANINAKTNYGKNILHIAIQERKTDIAEMLLNKGFDPKLEDINRKYPSYRIIINSIVNRIKILLGKRIDINAKTKNGRTLLHIAIEKGDIDMVKMLLKRGVKLDIKNKSGCNPLQWAIILNNEDIFKIILKKVRNDYNDEIFKQYINSQNIHEKSALDLAKQKNESILNILSKELESIAEGKLNKAVKGSGRSTRVTRNAVSPTEVTSVNSECRNRKSVSNSTQESQKRGMFSQAREYIKDKVTRRRGYEVI